MSKSTCFLIALLGVSCILSAQCRWDSVTRFQFDNPLKNGIKVAFSLKGKLYLGVSDTLNNFYRYDIKKDSLVPKADIPGKYPTNGVLDTLNGKAYLIRSVTINGNHKGALAYDPKLDTWSKKAIYPGSDLGAGCGCSFDGKMYFGLNSGNKSWWSYDPIKDTFIKKDNFPDNQSRALVNCIVVNDRFFILGGQKDDLTEAKDIWEYLPQADTFEKVLEYHEPTRGASFVLGGKVYIFQDPILQFNPGSEEITAYEKMPLGIITPNLGLTFDSKGYFFALNEIYSYDPNLPKPSMKLKDTSLCRRDSIQLDAGNPKASHQWSTGDTTQTITVREYGRYSVTVTDSNNCQASDTAHISSIVDLQRDTGLCYGDTLTLNAGNPGAKYDWNTNATSRTIEVVDSGQYYVEVDDGGCLGSDTINVDTHTNPRVDLGRDTSFCEGKSLVLRTDYPRADHYWQDTVQNSTYRVNTPGIYHVLVIDQHGCSGRDSVRVSSRPSPAKPEVERIAEDSLRSSLSGERYIWYLDGGRLGKEKQMIRIKDTGDYRVAVVAQNGCLSPLSDAKTINTLDTGSSGIKDIWNETVRLYPIPAREKLVVKLNNRNFKAEKLILLNLKGQVMRERIVRSKDKAIHLSTGQFPSGVYELKVVGRKSTKVSKVLLR